MIPTSCRSHRYPAFPTAAHRRRADARSRHYLAQNTVFRRFDADVTARGSIPLVALEICEEVSDGIRQKAWSYADRAF